MTRPEFKKLYLDHGRRLYRIAFQMTGNQAEAEDAVQETFLRALRTLDSYDERGVAGGWLSRILLNVVREAGRRRVKLRDQFLPELIVRAGGGAGRDSDLDQQAVQQEQAQRVFWALAQLPDTFRDVLVLRHLDGQSTSEVATTLGLCEPTVRSRLKRARDMLMRLCCNESTATEEGKVRS